MVMSLKLHKLEEGSKERKKEKSALTVEFEPTPLASQASAEPLSYGRTTNATV